MPSVTIGLPPSFAADLRQTDVPCDAGTVGEALRLLAEEHPHYESRIFYGRRLLVVVTLNGKHLPPADVMETSLAEGDRIDLLPPVAGG